MPFEAIVAKARKTGYHQVCLHPEASPESCGKIASAHTLQRSRVLREIESADHHVLTFYPAELVNGRLEVHRRGWKKASTFEAFCDKHDSSTFVSLETEPFVGSKEQIALIGYRAVCWELYQKVRAIRSNQTMQELLDRGTCTETQKVVQSMLGVRAAGLAKGYEDAKRTKIAMDNAILSRNYSAYSSYRIMMKGSLDIASTGGISPNRTLSGVALQVLHDAKAKTEWLSFGVDVDEGDVSVVFFWDSKDAAPSRYVTEISQLSDAALACFLPQFFFAHCENTYFSQSWWDNLGRRERSFVEILAGNDNPYYFPPPYDLSRRLTSWAVTERELG